MSGKREVREAYREGLAHALAVLDVAALAGLGMRGAANLLRSGKSLEAIRADLLAHRNYAPEIRGQHSGHFGPTTGTMAARMAARYSKGA